MNLLDLFSSYHTSTQYTEKKREEEEEKKERGYQVRRWLEVPSAGK